MTYFEAFFLGTVQGLTEFIPVSSSGHIYILPFILGMSIPDSSFVLAVQIGTLLALLIYFKKKLIRYISVFNLVLRRKKLKFKHYQDLYLVRNVVVATIPGGILGFIVNEFLENYYDKQIYGSNIALIVVAIPLLIVGILFLFENKFFKNNKLENNELTTSKSLIVGFSQTLAFVRGVSRSGITLLAGQLVGLKRVEAAEFSFLMSIPIISITSVLGFVNILQSNIQVSIVNMFVGIIASFLSGYWAIGFLLKFLKTKGLQIFGYYRILFSFILLLIFALK